MTKLQVFADISSAVKKFFGKDLRLDRFLFVCVQHELYAAVVMFEYLISFGIPSKNIYLIGKHYSTCESVVAELKKLGIFRYDFPQQETLADFRRYFTQNIDRMWEKVANDRGQNIEAIIVLDDGGRCISSVPAALLSKYNFVAIEQTTSGIVDPNLCNFPYPVIDVASSAAKLQLESPIIGTAAIRDTVKKNLPIDGDKVALCAVIGLGYVGIAVVGKLISLGFHVLGYDIDVKKDISCNGFTRVDKLELVFKKASYIFGCTGTDITQNLDIDEIVDDAKILFSCSSEDKEFLTLLKKIRTSQQLSDNYDVLDDFTYTTSKGFQLKIVRGGFPITFDGSEAPAPLKDIQLTQGLLLAALLQASILLRSSQFCYGHQKIMLDPAIQEFIAKTWFTEDLSEKYSEELQRKFTDFQWIADNSGGTHLKLDDVCDMFGC